MQVVPIRQAERASRTLKVVPATQKAIDALPLNSGMWSVEGEQGLYVRCQVASKAFRLERRVFGTLVKATLKADTLKSAKAEAKETWGRMKPTSGAKNLGAEIEAYIRHRRTMNKMAPATEKLARYNAERYLNAWKDRSMERIGTDRGAIADLHALLTERHGSATCNQVMRLLAAVYRWYKDRSTKSLPDWPRKVAEIHTIPARDWAYPPDELRAWWHHTVKPKGSTKAIAKGVSTLGPIKRMWWLTALLTGARKGSIEALRWADVDLKQKILHFKTAKGGMTYGIPIGDTLAELLTTYRKSTDVPPSEWLFPSSAIHGAHVKDVKDSVSGVGPAHRLRHTFRTTLAQLGASLDQAKMLMGHSMGGDVSRGYISTPLMVESLRPITNAVSAHYLKILGPLTIINSTW